MTTLFPPELKFFLVKWFQVSPENLRSKGDAIEGVISISIVACHICQSGGPGAAN